MLDKKELLTIYDREMRIGLRLPDSVFEHTGRVVRDLDHTENVGFIDYANLDEPSADEEINAQIAYFQALNMPFTWKVYDHDRPVNLRQRLAAHGFTVDVPSKLMVLDLQNAPGYFSEMQIPEQIQRITDEAGIEGIVRLEEEVYQSSRARLLQRLLHLHRTHPELLSLYAAVIDQRIVSAAWIIYYQHTQFASLLGGATLPEYRSRGFYTALLVVRAREALQHGVRFLAVDASPMSAPILEKHGFQSLGQTIYCRWSPG